MRGSTISTFFRVRFNFMLTWAISDDVTRTKAACKSNPRSKEVQQQQQYIHAHQHAPAPAPACSRTHAHVYTRTPTSMHTFSHTRARARASSDALAAILCFSPPPKKGMGSFGGSGAGPRCTSSAYARDCRPCFCFVERACIGASFSQVRSFL